MREPDDLFVHGIQPYTIALRWLPENAPNVKDKWEAEFLNMYGRSFGADKVLVSFHYANRRTGVNVPLYEEGDYI